MPPKLSKQGTVKTFKSTPANPKAQAAAIWDQQIAPVLASGGKVGLVYAANNDQTEEIHKAYKTGKVGSGKCGQLLGGGTGQAEVFAELAKMIEAAKAQDSVHILPVATSLHGGPDTNPNNKVTPAHTERDMKNIASHVGAGWNVIGFHRPQNGPFSLGGKNSTDWVSKQDAQGKTQNDNVQAQLVAMKKPMAQWPQPLQAAAKNPPPSVSAPKVAAKQQPATVAADTGAPKAQAKSVAPQQPEKQKPAATTSASKTQRKPAPATQEPFAKLKRNAAIGAAVCVAVFGFPIGTAAVAAVGAVHAARKLYENRENIKQGFKKVADAAKNVVSSIGNGIKKGFNAIKNFDFKQAITSAAQAVGNAAKAGMKAVVKGAVKAVLWTKDIGFPAVASAAKQAWSAVKRAPGALWQGMKSVGATIKDGAKAAWSAAKEAPGALWQGMKSVGATIKDGATAAWSATKEAPGALWQGMKSVGATIKDGATAAWSAAKEAPGAIWNEMKSAGNSIKSTASDAWDAVKDTASNALQSLNNVRKSFKDIVAEAKKELGIPLTPVAETPTLSSDAAKMMSAKDGKPTSGETHTGDPAGPKDEADDALSYG